jgi:glycerol-3-phosphate O-acyltransferase
VREAEARLEPLLLARPRILLDYLESYLVVMRTLRTLVASDGLLPEPELFRRSHEIGKQHLLQDRVHAPELLSSVNFRNALSLATNLGAARGTPEGVGVGDSHALQALEADLERLTQLARG